MWLSGRKQYRHYEKNGFSTTSGKVELYSKQLKDWGYDPLPVFYELPETPQSEPALAGEYPLILTNYKRMQYLHSNGRQIDSLRHTHSEPIVYIHPEMAEAQGIQAAVNRFHQTHEEIYSHHDLESPVEFVSLRAVHTYLPPRPSLPKWHIEGTLSEAQKGERDAYFELPDKPVQTPIYDRGKLPLSAKIDGPAIVEQADTTTIIYPNHKAHLDEYGNLIIDIPNSLTAQ